MCLVVLTAFLLVVAFMGGGVAHMRVVPAVFHIAHSLLVVIVLVIIIPDGTVMLPLEVRLAVTGGLLPYELLFCLAMLVVGSLCQV